jgi:hypothetical protein
MATFPTQTQNGNTSSTSVYSGGGITNHEAWAVQIDSGSSGAIISNIISFINPTRYQITTTVVGAGAIAFQLNSDGV